MKLKLALIIYNIILVLTLAFIIFSEIKQSKSISFIESVLQEAYFVEE